MLTGADCEEMTARERVDELDAAEDPTVDLVDPAACSLDLVNLPVAAGILPAFPATWRT